MIDAPATPAALPRADLLLVDVDGTIKGPKKMDFSDNLRGAFTDFIDHGGQIAIVSGRAPHQVRDIAQQLGIIAANERHHRPTLFAGNLGAAVGSTDGTTSSVGLPPGIGMELARAAVDQNLLIHIAQPDHDYYNHLPPDEPQFTAYRDVLKPEVHESDPLRLMQDAEGANVIRIMNPTADITRIAETYPDVVVRPDLSLGAPVALIQPRDAEGRVADKGTAAKMIQDRLGIAPENTYAFGDLESVDGPMFYRAHGVAVANAEPGLTAMAEYTCPPYFEDGVATFVRQLPTPA